MPLITSPRSKHCLVDLPPDPVLARQDLALQNDRIPRFVSRIPDTMAQTHRSGRIVIVLLIGAVLIVNRLFSKKLDENVGLVDENARSVENRGFRIDFVASAENRTVECEVEPWNNVSTESFSFKEIRTKWRELNIGRWGNLEYGKLWPVGAFVYKEEIVVTTATQNRYGKPVFCRYFDCNRKEIPDSAFPTHMFPVTSAYCARRAGAKFMGLTDTKDEEIRDMVPITFRAYDKPIHDVSVCVGPLYGEESRWLEIVETTEHHILMGINHFYFTVFNNVDSYTRRLLDEYQQLGNAEVTVIQGEYKTMDWMFHMMQITDCFFRARHHSKWILNVDIDERLVMTQMPLLSFLKTVPDDIGEISFSSYRVKRTGEMPKEYTGVEDLKKQLLFLNYHSSAWRSFAEMKGMLRPDKMEGMFYHFTWEQYPGVRVMSASRKIGYSRHYRTTLPSLSKTWIFFVDFEKTKLDSDFEQKLLEAITRRVKRVYGQRPMWCEEVTPHLLTIFSQDNYHCIWKQNGTRFTSSFAPKMP